MGGARLRTAGRARGPGGVPAVTQPQPGCRCACCVWHSHRCLRLLSRVPSRHPTAAGGSHPQWSHHRCSKGLGAWPPGDTGTPEAVPKPASPWGGGHWPWTPGVLLGTRPSHPMVPGGEGSQGPGSPGRTEPSLLTGPAPNPRREAGAPPQVNGQQPADATPSAGRCKDNKMGGTFQTGALPGRREGPRAAGGVAPGPRGPGSQWPWDRETQGRFVSDENWRPAWGWRPW